MPLKVHSAGAVLELKGTGEHGVVLTGPQTRVREAAALFGERVKLVELGEYSRMSKGIAAFDAAIAALSASVSVMRQDLRSMIECGCRASGSSTGVDFLNPPLPHSLSEGSRSHVAVALIAIREAESVLTDAGIGCRADAQPDWLDQVIDGKIEI